MLEFGIVTVLIILAFSVADYLDQNKANCSCGASISTSSRFEFGNWIDKHRDC